MQIEELILRVSIICTMLLLLFIIILCMIYIYISIKKVSYRDLEEVEREFSRSNSVRKYLKYKLKHIRTYQLWKIKKIIKKEKKLEEINNIKKLLKNY